MMGKNIAILILLFISLMVLVSCADREDYYTVQEEQTAQIIYQNLSGSMARYIDIDAGVVCWSLYSDSLSCLPLSETQLDIGR